MVHFKKLNSLSQDVLNQASKKEIRENLFGKIRTKNNLKKMKISSDPSTNSK